MEEARQTRMHEFPQGGPAGGTERRSGERSELERHIGMIKKPRIGLPVKGESTIREGFGLIYQAIFRTSAPTQEDLISTMETYNCPEHGQACDDPDCDYKKKLAYRF